MTETKTFTAVISNSALNGPEIAITDDSGYVLLWLDVPGRSCTLEELTHRLVASDFVIAGEWRTIFSRSGMSLTVEVRSDREL